MRFDLPIQIASNEKLLLSFLVQETENNVGRAELRFLEASKYLKDLMDR